MASFPPPRSPQIQVVGSALQDRFDSYGENIDVGTDQLDFQSWPQSALSGCPPPGAATLTAHFELAGNEHHYSLGVYLTADPITLYEIFPTEAAAGWFAAVSFRSSPDRLVVHLFDETAAFRGTTTYPDVPRETTAFYVRTSSLTLHSEDARNPNGDAQSLAFGATGPNAGSLWLCWEDQTLQASEHDFNDLILFIDRNCGLPVRQTTWGRLKARFR